MSEFNVLPFFRSYRDAFKDLPDPDRLKMYDCIFSYAFDGEEPELTGLLGVCWTLLRPNILKSIHRSENNARNGAKGGRPKTQQKPSQNPTQTQAEPTQKADISLNKENGLRNKENGLKNNYFLPATKKEKFMPPSLEEVQAYCTERGNNIDPNLFIDFYSAKGWKVGAQPMKDWRAAVRTWERNGGNSSRNQKADEQENPFSYLTETFSV